MKLLNKKQRFKRFYNKAILYGWIENGLEARFEFIKRTGVYPESIKGCGYCI